MKGHGAEWIPEADEMVYDLVKARFSGNEIAIRLTARFGIVRTRSAVLGRMGRLGIKAVRAVSENRASECEKPRAAPNPRPDPKPGSQRPDIGIRAANAPAKIVPPYKPKPDPIEPGTLTLMQLTADTCRWPNGAQHCRMAYQPYERRRVA
jgi:hypothetical protein